MIWASVEVGTLIILGSIPPLRPLFMRIVYGVKSMTTHTSATQPTYDGHVMSTIKRPTRSGDEDMDRDSLGSGDGILVSHSVVMETKNL